ncbi:MAG: 3-dehydroquinate synthase [Thermoanaerobacteraceae bacterium]|nr:3-dehydroquinate synthase [Thermoanaerobacteraceae bacterium]
MEVINIDLKDRSYPIYICNNMLDDIGKVVCRHTKSKRIFLVTDTNVYPLYYEKVKAILNNAGFDVSKFVIPAGESSKNLDMLKNILEDIYKSGLLRDGSIIALGGGVVGDIAGFAAATYMRGVDFIQIPTTLLAQVDSSVGGKVGVNLRGGKNIVGAFHQPKMVYIDTSNLRTLNKREILGGLAEIIKYGVIWDKELFEYLECNMDEILNLNDDMITHIIKKSCGIKGKVVSLDEKEQKLRQILNYGHTVGHAIEALTGYEKYIHGEAVAIGMVYAAKLSLKKSLIDKEYFDRICALIKKSGLPVEYGELHKEDIVELIRHDKKNKNDKIRFVLPVGYGKVDIFEINKDEILSILD